LLKFDSQIVEVITEDGENIKFENGSLQILDDDENLVIEINDEGIFVEDDGEKVIIDSEGIFVKDGDEEKNIHNFWGKLLSGFVRSITGGVMSLAGDSSERIVRHIINDNDHDFDLSFDSDDNERITKDIYKTRDAKPNAEVELKNPQGSVKISSWEKNFVDIHAELSTRKDEKEFDKIEISIKERKNMCLIETIEKSENPKVNVNYVVKIPQNMSIFCRI